MNYVGLTVHTVLAQMFALFAIWAGTLPKIKLARSARKGAKTVVTSGLV